MDTSSKWLTLTALVLMTLVLNVDVTAVNLALAPIAKDLHMSMAEVQWIINGCLIAIAMFMTTAGRLGDLIGHERVFFLGAFIFLIGSIAGGLAQSGWSIIVARLIQGVGIAFNFPMIYAIIFRDFPDNQRGLATGIVSTMVGFAMAIGPTVGGILIDFASWRWIFFVNVPIVLVSCFLLYFVRQPQTAKQPISIRLDYISVTLLSLGLFILMLTLNEGSKVYSILGFSFLIVHISFEVPAKYNP